MAARKTITVGEWQSELSRAMQHYKIAPAISFCDAVAERIRTMSEKGELATAVKVAGHFPNRDVHRALRTLLGQGRIFRAGIPRGNQPAAYVYNPRWREEKR